LADFCCTAVNFSVCVVLWALATAGISNAPVPPRITAALAAAMDVRIFMVISMSIARLV
jgi:glycerol uptake facilitator-like aquaporin